MIDRGVAFLALLVLAPILAAIALLIVIESRGPILYRADRVGYRGRTLRMLKFRKMVRDATGPALTTARDARLTSVGRVLARWRLDELPQLWHVLRGDMSLVGPRPEDPRFVARYPHEYDEILRVRPGLTGWTQLAFANEPAVLRPNDPVGHYIEAILPQKVALDRLYASRPTLAVDARILWSTLLTVVAKRPIAVDRATGAMTLRRRRTGAPTPQFATYSEAAAAAPPGQQPPTRRAALDQERPSRGGGRRESEESRARAHRARQVVDSPVHTRAPATPDRR